MNASAMTAVRAAAMLLCCLLGASPAPSCDWDRFEERGLDLTSASPDLGSPRDVSDAEQCKAACCSRSDCDAALVGAPQDGGLQCYLVTCWLLGSDQCQLTNSSQFQVHRRRRQRGRESLLRPLLAEPKEENQTDQARCRLPMKVGSCRAAFPKFYYDLTNQSCRSFTYGGCEANDNNFETVEDCEAACAGVTGSVLPDTSKSSHDKAPRMAPRFYQGEGPEATSLFLDTERVMAAGDFAERCGAEPEVGPCRAALPHWYYDSQTGSCRRFLYGGCRGNQNNYVSEDSCMDTCVGVTVLPTGKKVDLAEDQEEHCLSKPDPGPCRAAFPMFYYDPDTNSCRSFVYGGCQGNGNRHSSKDECLTRCSLGDWANSGRAGRRWTTGFFLFMTLAAISVMLLAALVIFLLKCRRFARRTSSNSDKQELLPEAEDQLSVESLSLPESPQANQA